MPLFVAIKARIEKTKNRETFLELRERGLNDDAIQELVELIRGSAIVRLDLSRNMITMKGAEHLSKCYQLVEIILEQNGLGDSGAKCFAQNAQHESSHLVILDLAQNGLTDDGAQALLPLLEKRPFDLTLDNNPRISPDLLGKIMGKSRSRIEAEFSKPRSPFSNCPVLLSPKSGMPISGPSRNKRHAADENPAPSSDCKILCNHSAH